jgi:glycosyltransferase involved in cell wall biosynthesis
VGLVVIGRNEGERLRRCLESAVGRTGRIVYVDSGSTDGSVGLAKSMGIEVVDLDTSIKFTAARARNEGARRLLQVAPDTTYIQFVDGDCEIVSTWWDAAVAYLEERPEVAVVCGRRRERFPEKSVYNKLCDIEWNTPCGDAQACGGDSMMRVEHFQAVGGFNPELIAGEEPELCFRLRAKGWKIHRLDAEMTLHDAAMYRIGQWWRREKRTGHATAEGAAMYGRTPERYRRQPNFSNYFWGLAIPLLAIVPAWWTRGWSLLILGLYIVQWFRIQVRCKRQRGMGGGDARMYAAFLLMGKFPQVLGQINYWLGRMLRRQAVLIEYKGTDEPVPHVKRNAA